MRPVFRFRPNQPVSWYSQRRENSNQHCLYCGQFIGVRSTAESSREHWVARNFVPRGTLDSSAFNFIFRACVACNRRKADAERHVSSVSLLNSPAREHDPRAEAEAIRKASKDFHPTKKGKLVQDAWISHEITSEFGAAAFSFNLVAPPQLAREPTMLLAFNHVQAAFSLIASLDPRVGETTTLLAVKFWKYFGAFAAGDWGNPQLVEVASRVAARPILAHIHTADGYFKFIARRDDPDGSEWFWALEWNKAYRVFGAINAPDVTPDTFSNLPALDWQASPDGRRRFRTEIPASPATDTLFEFLPGAI